MTGKNQKVKVILNVSRVKLNIGLDLNSCFINDWSIKHYSRSSVFQLAANGPGHEQLCGLVLYLVSAHQVENSAGISKVGKNKQRARLWWVTYSHCWQ